MYIYIYVYIWKEKRGMESEELNLVGSIESETNKMEVSCANTKARRIVATRMEKEQKMKEREGNKIEKKKK